MKEAYDKVLQTIVTAEDAAMNRGFEPYRFECLYCGEEVRIAAPFSTKKGTHFRHLHGNNDTECEEYLGIGAAALSESRNRGAQREVANIIYDSSTNTFKLRVKFSEEELDHYESENASIEIKTSNNEQIKNIDINHTFFAPNTYTSFILDKYSEYYYIAIDGKNNRTYSFVSTEQPIFFKIQGDEDDYCAKRLSSFTDTPVIYTGTRYLIVALSSSAINHLKQTLAHSLKKSFEINTMKGKMFHAMEIEINQYDSQLEEDLLSFGYRLEKSDSVVLLWPPAFVDNDIVQCISEKMYLYTSFPFHPHCGNNLDTEDIEAFDDNVSIITVDNGVKIIRKSTELEFGIIDSIQPYDEQTLVNRQCERYMVPEEGTSILFDDDGARCLTPGQTIHMSSKRSICRYQNNTLIEIITPKNEREYSDKEIVAEAEMYYKRTGSCDKESFFELSEFAQEYLNDHADNCNLAVMHLIKEGLI